MIGRKIIFMYVLFDSLLNFWFWMIGQAKLLKMQFNKTSN